MTGANSYGGHNRRVRCQNFRTLFASLLIGNKKPSMQVTGVPESMNVGATATLTITLKDADDYQFVTPEDNLGFDKDSKQLSAKKANAKAQITFTPTKSGATGDPVTFSVNVSEKPSIQVTGIPESMKVGDTATLTIQLANGATDYDVATPDDNLGFDKGSKQLSAKKANATAQITFTPKKDGVTGEAVTFKVNIAEAAKPSMTIENMPSSMRVGENATLNITLRDADDYKVATPDDNLGFDKGSKQLSAKKANAAAKITFTPTKSGRDGDPVTHTVNIAEAEAKPSMTIENVPETLKVGQVQTLRISLGNGATDYDVTTPGDNLGFNKDNKQLSAKKVNAKAQIIFTPKKEGVTGDPVTHTVNVTAAQ